MKPLAVFDIDNTLADTSHRDHFLRRTPRDWDAFFAAAPGDTILTEGVELLRTHAQECEIAYLTGRPEECRQDTITWLLRHQLPSGPMYMRRLGDYRPGHIVKMSVIKRFTSGREIRVLVDDDERVCDQASRLGLSTVHATWSASSSGR